MYVFGELSGSAGNGGNVAKTEQQYFSGKSKILSFAILKTGTKSS